MTCALFCSSCPTSEGVELIVVLAGGEGKRFGKDKLLALIEGRPAIELVLKEVGEDHLLLTVSEERCKLYGTTRCLIDKGRGPASALLELSGSFTSVPGDMPWIKKEVLERLEGFRRSTGSDVAVPVHGNGNLESLMLSVKDVDELKERIDVKGRSLRATDLIRAAKRVAFVGSSLLCRDPRAFAHINTQEDLKVRAPKESLGDGLIVLESEWNSVMDSLDLQLKKFKELGISQVVRHVMKDMSYKNHEGVNANT